MCACIYAGMSGCIRSNDSLSMGWGTCVHVCIQGLMLIIRYSSPRLRLVPLAHYCDARARQHNSLPVLKACSPAMHVCGPHTQVPRLQHSQPHHEPISPVYHAMLTVFFSR